MTELRVSDLHLKKELTQIRKAARVLRDPGTTRSWKSPLNSSRSVALNQSVDIDTVIANHVGSELKNPAKDKRVYLYNWKSQRSSSEKSGVVSKRSGAGTGGYEEDSESCFFQESGGDDVLSDARNPVDSRSETDLGESRSASMLFRCRDANLVSLSMQRVLAGGSMKKSTSSNAHLDVLSRYQQKEINLKRLLKSHPPLQSGFRRGESVEQSDDTDDYSHLEDLRKYVASSPSSLKLKNWAKSSSRLLRSSQKEDSSYSYSTPALSTSSFNRYYNRNASNIGSCDATTISLNDGDDELDDHINLPGRQGCGIPCWSKRSLRHRGGCRSCYSPSLSDTLRRKGSGILCGSQSIYRRHRGSPRVSNKGKIASRSAQGVLPLLRNSADSGGGSSMGSRLSDDELSTNVGELDLEALSRLDGRRWSNCCNQDDLDGESLNGEEEGSSENIRSLSQKYRPVFFSEVIGQSIVIQSLTNAISMRRIASVYLFQGPRGTGKRSTARIFGAALNCISAEDTKPCGQCRECRTFISGNSRGVFEVDGTDKQGIDKVRYILRKVSQGLQLGTSGYKVFIIDECHLLPSKMWLDFLKFLEEPPQQIVFVFITTDPDYIPRTVQSRCQKYLFNKIKDGDIAARLKKISTEENLDVESDALDLIALNVDGSLRNAETMLDQLSLLGKRITTPLVNELVGSVSDEKLLELLELAMSSDTAETVKRAKDLMDSGSDPVALVSQLASLIMDIIAGTHTVVDTKYGDSFARQSLTEAELKRLKHALKLLSKAEKQLRASVDRSTWFIATLLQLGSVASPSLTQSNRHSLRTNEEDPSSASIEATAYKRKSDSQYLSQRSISLASVYREMNGNFSYLGESNRNVKLAPGQLVDRHASSAIQDDELEANMLFGYSNSDKLDDIWLKCIKGCHSKTLRQLLHVHGKLLSISQREGILVVYVAFNDDDIKARAERFLSSITNSIEMVLRNNVEVRLICLSSEDVAMIGANNLLLEGQNMEPKLESRNDRKANYLDIKTTAPSTKLLPDANAEPESDSMNEGTQEVPMQRIESIIREQRLETAWLQAVEKGTPRSLSRMRPEKNQVLPQENILTEPNGSFGISSHQVENKLNREIKVLKLDNQDVLHKEHIRNNVDQSLLSPSLLHNGNSYKQLQGYESSTGGRDCCAIFCLRTGKRPRVKGKGTIVRPRRKGSRYLLFGKHSKHKKN